MFRALILRHYRESRPRSRVVLYRAYRLDYNGCVTQAAQLSIRHHLGRREGTQNSTSKVAAVLHNCGLR